MQEACPPPDTRTRRSRVYLYVACRRSGGARHAAQRRVFSALLLLSRCVLQPATHTHRSRTCRGGSRTARRRTRSAPRSPPRPFPVTALSCPSAACGRRASPRTPDADTRWTRRALGLAAAHAWAVRPVSVPLFPRTGCPREPRPGSPGPQGARSRCIIMPISRAATRFPLRVLFCGPGLCSEGDAGRGSSANRGDAAPFTFCATGDGGDGALRGDRGGGARCGGGELRVVRVCPALGVRGYRGTHLPLRAAGR